MKSLLTCGGLLATIMTHYHDDSNVRPVTCQIHEKSATPHLAIVKMNFSISLVFKITL
jgi:hypothetical protein